MADTIFNVEWDDLTLGYVVAFLADAGDEGITWEAKGTERPHPGSVRKAACAFANSVEGGFLLVGVRREGGAWVADGVDFRDEESTTWLGRIIGTGLRPVPRYDVRAWPSEGAGHVAVVRVEPVAEPPCMTTSGEIFERVSGESVKVTDPAVLARLQERGKAASVRAEATALGEAERVGFRDVGEPPFLVITFGLAPIELSEDIAAKLFTGTFATLLGNTVEGLPSASHAKVSSVQDAVLASTGEATVRWAGRASWNGGVGILFEIVHPGGERWTRMTVEALFEDRIHPAAYAAMRLVKAMGGSGRAHAVLLVGGRGFTLTYGAFDRYLAPEPDSLRPIQRWTGDDGEVTDAILESMKRELMRAVGAETWEPETEPT